jgi:hypothetical protein
MAKSYSVYRSLGEFRDEPLRPGPSRLPAAIEAVAGLAENLDRWLDPHLTSLDAPGPGETVSVWSVFSYLSWIGVARALVTAPGTAERGLVHARLWRLDELEAGEDPGV